jgi:hypothetical protein
MGQTLSEPNVEKNSHYDKNELLVYGFSEMQGWRLSKLYHCCIVFIELIVSFKLWRMPTVLN